MVVPSMETKMAFGMPFRTPGDRDRSPFRNRTRSFAGTWHSAHWLTANIDSAELRHCWESVDNNFGEHANMPTKLTTVAGGSASIA